MKKEEILKGIKAYHHEQAVLLRLIRKSANGLNDDKFDKLFDDYKETIASNGDTVRTKRRPKLRFLEMSRHSFILGSLRQGFCDWSKWLNLLQLMCMAGLTKADQENGHVVYRIL